MGTRAPATAVMEKSCLQYLPLECLERVLHHLDFMSAFLLSCASARLRTDTLRLWLRTHHAPATINDLDESTVSVAFGVNARRAISDSALHTSSSCFEYSSVIPHPLPLRHAAAALDIPSMLAVLPPWNCALDSVDMDGSQAEWGCSKTDGSKRSRAPAAKLTPLQVAVICHSARAVQALLLDKWDRRDPMLIDNDDGVHESLNLDVSKLPNAHLGYYCDFDTNGRRTGICRWKNIGARIANGPDEKHSSPYDVETCIKRCVNPKHLLEVAVLCHNPDICEMLCHQTQMKAPVYSVAELLSPNGSVCAATFTRLGTERSQDSSDFDMQSLTCGETGALDESNFQSHGTPSTIVLYCENLDACPYVQGLLRICKAMAATARLSGNSSMTALHHAADFGDENLMNHLLQSCSDKVARIANVIKRIRWRLLYDSAKYLKMRESMQSAVDAFQTDIPMFRSCAILGGRPQNIYKVRKTSQNEFELLLSPFASRLAERRHGILRYLSELSSFN